ncbi:neuronal acetylcholine receptor subunit alpha-7-like protein [Dermatophagoides farinae]|uniref:Neuronal acetylcholine receptor subunit alpha-7-like protein n=1 Tax=Dermatophagoides farinae TaxID=6954 RepID=A0A9D4P7Z9_DERFA|nr:neuronal acetylcholine receptor subunit alpha-7-like protein [Dermatophagoides farinae]
MICDLVYGGINERHLINHLLNNYNPLERPVENENDTLNVIFGITLQQIIDVDEKNQILISNLWLKFQWVDINLRWNPEEYGGVETLRIMTDRIWIPDVLMYNSADERFDSTFRTNVVVNYTGGCLYVPPGVFKSTCRIDITWFPFDDQRCELKFGSWTYDGLQVDLLPENVSADTSDYQVNSEWVLVDVPSIRTSQYYECCPGPFVDIKFIIHIKRRTLYYGFNLIIPCIILSSMTLLSFSSPPESGEKLHLGVTILLSMTVFLVQLSKILPATSDSISIIALYFGSIMVMVAVSVVMTVVVLNFHHRSSETKEMGPKLRKFLLDWLPRLLGMDRPGIKPPKQCILKKVSSTQKLVAALGCAVVPHDNDNNIHKQNFATENPDLNFAAADEVMLMMQTTGLTGNANLTCNSIPKLNSPPTVVPLDCDDDRIPHQIENVTNNADHRYLFHPNLYMESADDVLHEHESNCLFLQRTNDSVDKSTSNNHHHNNLPLVNNSDSIDLTKTDDLFSCRDDTRVEDDGPGSEDCLLDEDLDVEVSIAMTGSRTRLINNKKDGLNKINESRNNLTDKGGHNVDDDDNDDDDDDGEQDESHNEIDPEHYGLHQYMSMKRRHKLLEILIEMRFITDRLREEDQIKELIAEWRYGATVLDRLCLILFTLFTLLSLAICLISAPQLIV